MTINFSEDEVHTYLYQQGMEALTIDFPNLEQDLKPDDEFELWKLIKQKAISKLSRIHDSVRYGEFIATKLKLPTDKTTPMELDLLGTHEDGLFVLELKVNRAAERNAFSELFAYSNYISGMFPGSGKKDITNILVANLDAKITQQAFLYDLIITDRDIIVYQPEFSDESLNTLSLTPHVPSDEVFKQFTNDLLSHESMSCIVASFDDMDGWFDNNEDGGSLNSWTKKHLEQLSNYTAQLMEAEGLHGFVYMRKPWKEIPWSNKSSLIICALNPFKMPSEERGKLILEQIDNEDHIMALFENPASGFQGRLIRIAQKAVKDSFTHDHDCYVELPLWEYMVTSFVETTATHNFAFRPTGLLREAYVAHLDNIYLNNLLDTEYQEDVSMLKINEINNWFRAWEFMTACGFRNEKDA